MTRKQVLVIAVSYDIMPFADRIANGEGEEGEGVIG
jgi:hypothetical protein